MAFNVRVYGHRGIVPMPVNQSKQFSADSVFQLVQPYEFAEVISVSGAAASSAANNDATEVRVLRVEVPDGQAVRYEINPPNRSGGAVTANTNSPILSGKDQFYFRPGWTISLIDASGLP